MLYHFRCISLWRDIWRFSAQRFSATLPLHAGENLLRRGLRRGRLRGGNRGKRRRRRSGHCHRRTSRRGGEREPRPGHDRNFQQGLLLAARTDHNKSRATRHKKERPSFDFPIALGMIAVTEELDSSPFENFSFVGELALDGSVRPVKGVLPAALEARRRG